MVIFDQLRISDDGHRMYINVHVNTADYFENVYLDSITVMTADKALEANDHLSPGSEYLYRKTFPGEVKEAGIVLDMGVLAEAFNNTNDGAAINPDKPTATLNYNKSDFSHDLFFVYVVCHGAPDECTPCALCNEVTIGATFDTALFYQKVMNYTRQLADDCNEPQGFIDFILLWNGFKTAVETEHYIAANDFYKKLFSEYYGGTGSTGSGRGCGCHG